MKRIIAGILLIIAGAVTAIGPYTFLHVCSADGMASMGGMEAKCAGIPLVSLITGIALAVIGLAIVLVRSNIILSLLGVVAGVVIIGIPTFIIGVCEEAHMHCHMVTRPALIVIGAIAIVVSLIPLTELKKEESKVEG